MISWFNIISLTNSGDFMMFPVVNSVAPYQGWPLVAIHITTIYIIPDKLMFLQCNWHTGLFTCIWNGLICFLSYYFAVWVNMMQSEKLKLMNKCVWDTFTTLTHVYTPPETLKRNKSSCMFVLWWHTQIKKIWFEVAFDGETIQVTTLCVHEADRSLMVLQMDQWCLLNGCGRVEVEIWHLQRFTLLDIL